MKGYLFLAIAILLEVIATSALKASNQLTKLVPSLIMGVGYLSSFYFLSLTLKVIPIGISYAIWSGTGIVLIALVGWLFFKQPPDFPAILGMGLIIAGVLVINLFSDTVVH